MNPEPASMIAKAAAFGLEVERLSNTATTPRRA
jgi:hypothetical protein